MTTYRLIVRRVVGGVELDNWTRAAEPPDEATGRARFDALVAAGGYDVRLSRIFGGNCMGQTLTEHVAPRLGEPVACTAAGTERAAGAEAARPYRLIDLDPRWCAVLCALRRGPRGADEVAEAIGDADAAETVELLRTMARAKHVGSTFVGRSAGWHLSPAGRDYLTARGVW